MRWVTWDCDGIDPEALAGRVEAGHLLVDVEVMCKARQDLQWQAAIPLVGHVLVSG